MKLLSFLLTAALVFPFFARAQEGEPPAAPTLNDPALDGLPANTESHGAITQPPAAPPKEVKKASKKKPKKDKKASAKKNKKDSKKAKKSKKKKHHAS